MTGFETEREREIECQSRPIFHCQELATELSTDWSELGLSAGQQEADWQWQVGIFIGDCFQPHKLLPDQWEVAEEEKAVRQISIVGKD